MNAYVLPGLRLKGQAGRTRGASLFAWHGGSDTLAVAVKRRWGWLVLSACAAATALVLPQCSVMLSPLTESCCVFGWRRLLLFKYDGLEFVEQREVRLFISLWLRTVASVGVTLVCPRLYLSTPSAGGPSRRAHMRAAGGRQHSLCGAGSQARRGSEQ